VQVPASSTSEPDRSTTNGPPSAVNRHRFSVTSSTFVSSIRPVTVTTAATLRIWVLTNAPRHTMTYPTADGCRLAAAVIGTRSVDATQIAGIAARRPRRPHRGCAFNRRNDEPIPAPEPMPEGRLAYRSAE
jgi:hypothetical protein